MNLRVRDQMAKLRSTSAPSATVLVRLLVGGVFLLEGLKKFLFVEQWGAGRFAHIGIPWRQVMAPFDGAFEVACGVLLLVGLLTRLAAVPLLIDITVAIVSTKIPVLLGHGIWKFTLMKLPRYGFLSMIHEARTDLSMLLGLIFLLVVGPGRWSLDTWRAKKHGN